ncbi:MAG: patatin-like phospholipase family protein [Deltaproteobacteria bacterium]|nr:patatin-like phospholipase family protein [Deltaproteobacteria bacterium]
METPKKERMAFMLSGGGARAAYQLGVLKYIFTELKCIPASPIILGTSAGAINAFFLTLRAHEGLDKAIIQLCDLWSHLTVNNIYRTDPWSVFKGLGNFLYNFTLGRFIRERHTESLLDTTPLYLMLRKAFEDDHHHLHRNIEEGLIQALGISAMQYGTAKTVTFFESSPHSGLKEWERGRREGRQTKLRLKHVLASAAIPIIFPSVKLENNYYADGSVRAAAPLSAAIQLGATKILAIHLARKSREQLKPLAHYPSVSQIVGMLFNTIFLDALDFDLRVLNRVNHLISLITHIKPNEDLKKVDVTIVRPSEDLGLLSLPHKKDLPKTLLFLLKGLGPTDKSGADFLSYLLFDGRYAEILIAEGMKDAHLNREELLRFFSGVALKNP